MGQPQGGSRNRAPNTTSATQWKVPRQVRSKRKPPPRPWRATSIEEPTKPGESDAPDRIQLHGGDEVAAKQPTSEQNQKAEDYRLHKPGDDSTETAKLDKEVGDNNG